MTPHYFWRCSPRKFNALCKVHADLRAPKKGQNEQPKLKGVPVGVPDSFIDQIPGLM